MPAKNHPSYNEENERSKYTINYVNKAFESIKSKKEHIDGEVDRVSRHFNSESSQDYIDMIINTTLQESMGLKLRNLEEARSKPYFGRVDFGEDGKSGTEKLYIGKVSLMRDEDQELVIVDWRAPVANLYYEARLGEASYVCPDGNIKGNLSLKRQFSFDEGELKEIFDIDITTNDEFLQSYLGASADNRLKDIVSTIQAEQNRIIRADMWTPLIVQGAAGSGKTTIALHRIAYLIYTFEKSFQPENFMIIAPNKLFLNYISEVLPELGVEKVKQTTFEDFSMELIGKKFKIRDANEKLVSFVDHNITEEQIEKNAMLKGMSEFKASMAFKEMIDEYISLKEKELIPEEDFTIASKVIFKYEDINNLFLKEYKNWPVMQRFNEIKKHLSNKLKLNKDAIINQLHDQCDRKIFRLKETMEDSDERQRLIIKAIDEKNEIIGKIETYSKKAVNEYIKKISKLTPFDYYKGLITDRNMFSTLANGKVSKEVAEFTREYTESALKSGFVEVEDFAPIIYLKYRMYGMDEKIPVRHIIIDEAQDFSVFQLYVLRKIVKDSSFTILGDLAQGIHSYRGTNNWEDVQRVVFDDRRSELLLLEQSYRTTVEIMEAANKVVGKLKEKSFPPAKPVIRHGAKVAIIQKQSAKEIAQGIGKKIVELKEENFKTIAVICKTMDECLEMSAALGKGSGEKPALITGKENEYRGGVVIVPSYLAKGLEFDAVIIANAGSEMYMETELDVKLLYVSMTRPLHRLYIYYCGELSPLLEGV